MYSHQNSRYLPRRCNHHVSRVNYHRDSQHLNLLGIHHRNRQDSHPGSHPGSHLNAHQVSHLPILLDYPQANHQLIQVLNLRHSPQKCRQTSLLDALQYNQLVNLQDVHRVNLYQFLLHSLLGNQVELRVDSQSLGHLLNRQVSLHISRHCSQLELLR